MFQTILSWIKAYGAKQLISQMDELELPIALKIKEAQAKLGQISPDEFSKLLVDDFQIWCCNKLNIDSSWVEKGASK